MDYAIGFVLTVASLVLLWIGQPYAAIFPAGASCVVLWRLLRRV